MYPININTLDGWGIFTAIASNIIEKPQIGEPCHWDQESVILIKDQNGNVRTKSHVEATIKDAYNPKENFFHN